MKNNRINKYWIFLGVICIIIGSMVPWKDIFISGPKIGIVEIKTPIIDSKHIVKNLNYFNEKSNVVGIVIRLDTPGGGVAASQEIYQKVKNISDKSEKPIIASMGGVAASGGYYIALGADTILANPGTTTGSIGVILGYPMISELMDKVGVKYESITSGTLKDAGSIFKDLSNNERKYFQQLIDDLHQQFITTVSYERKLPFEKVKKLANGQIFSGRQAKNAQLIDMLGTFEDAINIAANKAGHYGTPHIVYPPKEKKGLLAMLFGDIFQSSSMINLYTYPIPEYRLTNYFIGVKKCINILINLKN